LNIAYFFSLIGFLQITANEKGIQKILFENQFLNDEIKTENLTETNLENIQNEHLKNAFLQLKEYFEGKRTTFELELELEGSDFRKNVWKNLIKIPFGQTKTYAEFTTQIGNIKAIRAVAGANSKNIINIVVPCHRVLGANGHLTGYAGELWRKEWLLKHEGSRLF
jgi:methylated-DNA-[protein]-cysteine S-methyltransferase